MTHSTESQILSLDNQNQESFTLDKVSTTDIDGDNYLKAGELIEYKITLNYKGNFPLDQLTAILDENAPQCEDNEFIGQIGFYPRDFLDSTLQFQIVTSETIQIELELAWE